MILNRIENIQNSNGKVVLFDTSEINMILVPKNTNV